MKTRGKLFVVSGPAGVGKSAIVREILTAHPEVCLSVSCTTRAPREGELDGRDYHFVSDERFDELVAEDAFYEWAHVHQNRYGTLKATVDEELDKGKDLLLEIDVQGCLQVMAKNPDAASIFICPPSRANLEKRLRDRGTETEESIRVRLGNVARELQTAYQYDYLVIHNDWNEVPDALQTAASEVYSVITSKRLEKEARRGFLDGLMKDLESFTGQKKEE
ncbi:MAG: guanylate kinase [Clostridia bacterium]|nr:guanylate kinase [Clostridia bacterium]